MRESEPPTTGLAQRHSAHLAARARTTAWERGGLLITAARCGHRWPGLPPETTSSGQQHTAPDEFALYAEGVGARQREPAAKQACRRRAVLESMARRDQQQASCKYQDDGANSHMTPQGDAGLCCGICRDYCAIRRIVSRLQLLACLPRAVSIPAASSDTE